MSDVSSGMQFGSRAQPVVHSVCSARESDYNHMHACMHVYILKLQV